jgi:multicomponent Na+:H+ antiporter subunit G
MSVAEWIGGALVLIGAAFGGLAGIGQVRFSDLMTRMHVATKPATLGLLLVASGAMFLIGSDGAIPVLALTILLQFITGPVSAHLVGRAAHRHGDWEKDEVVMDDLADTDQL